MAALNIAYIRTSDRASFRRCRRRWGWSSHLKGNLEPLEWAAPLWLGTGVHWALEDYHGGRRYGTPGKALTAFAVACKKVREFEPPYDWKEQLELGVEMMDYYLDWLKGRDPLKTFKYKGRFQCEVRFEIEMPFTPPKGSPYDKVVYRGTLDRVAEDEWGRLWIVEYKTAKTFRLGHLETDGQVTAYCWAASVLYGRPIAGVVYQQHKKTFPEPPTFLKSGGYSLNKQQGTTRVLYKDALINLYGSLKKAPEANVEFLNYLASIETENRDKYIQRDWVYRNEHQLAAEGVKIMLEAEDMFNPNIALYPNPTSDCVWDCSFNAACIMMDDGSDWEHELKISMISRTIKENDKWRKLLKPKPAPNPLMNCVKLPPSSSKQMSQEAVT